MNNNLNLILNKNCLNNGGMITMIQNKYKANWKFLIAHTSMLALV